MMNAQHQEIRSFFARYEQRFNDALAGKKIDPQDVTASFTEWLMESSPAGVVCARNDEAFEKKIMEGFEFYKKIGTTALNIVSGKIEDLDEFHALAKIGWRYRAEKTGREIVIDFTVIYFLQLLNGKIRVFSYITGDEQQALKDHGLV